MRRAVRRAPAKVNLVFRIVGRRSDGYHLIDSLLVPVSLYDTLTIDVCRGRPRQVTCRVSGPERVAGGADNLAARAARSVLDALDVDARVDVHLHKRIPAGAGLGGGSSDAATVLKTLPVLLGRRLARPRQHEIAVALGADVAFFLACRPAKARGIGERLTAIDGFPKLALAIVVPRRRVRTAWAYANAVPSLTSRHGKSRVRRASGEVNPLPGRLFNDFEQGVARVVPDVGRISGLLRALGSSQTVMSGSGSAVVGVFESARAANRAVERFRAPDQAFAVRVLGRAPVAGN